MLTTFYAKCNKGSCNAAVFTDPGELEKHLSEVHQTKPRKLKPQTLPYRHKPLPSRPAVAPEKQRVTPGETFTHKGYECQIIGQTGPKYTALLVWTTTDERPQKDAELITTDPDGVRMYRITALTDKVVKALTH